MAWPYLTYAGLHHLHHRWNGCDPRDPGRTTPLLAESLSMGPLRRLMRRHLLWWRVDVLGGLGLIVDMARKGFWLQRLDQGLVQARFMDGAGVAVIHTAMLLIALTQLDATRTVSAGRWLNAWMGGLPHHCAHHAFPSIPSERLPIATRRIALALEHHGAPALPTLPSYREALIQLIADQNKQALS